MGTLNRITLLGRLGHDPEPRTSKGGKTFVRLSIATDRRHRGEEGELKRDTVWHSVFVWGKNADLCMQHCKRGHSIYVEGHLTSYASVVDGKKQYGTSIMVDQVQLIGPKTASPQASGFESLEDLEQLESDDELDTIGADRDSADQARPYQLN